MIIAVVLLILFVVFVVIWWIREPRIFIFLWHKMAFSAREGQANFVDKKAIFSESSCLENNWRTIQNELEEVLREKYVLPRFHHLDKANHKISFDTGPAWKAITLKAFDGWFDDNCKMFPKTVTMLKDMPSVTTAFFSILEPHVKIPGHTGKLSGLLRYHLGLSVPASPQCYIVVNGEKYQWKEGEGVIFDDTFFHAVTNDTDEYRIILLLDIKKKASVFFDTINNGILHLITLSPMFKKALKTGKIKTD